MRTLTWFIEGVPPLGVSQRETYRMDKAYIPERAWVHFDLAPTLEDVVFDIKADGVSIFDYALRTSSEAEAEEDKFSSAQIARDTNVSLEITSRGGNAGRGVTVGLDLEEA